MSQVGTRTRASIWQTRVPLPPPEARDQRTLLNGDPADDTSTQPRKLLPAANNLRPFELVISRDEGLSPAPLMSVSTFMCADELNTIGIVGVNVTVLPGCGYMPLGSSGLVPSQARESNNVDTPSGDPFTVSIAPERLPVNNEEGWSRRQHPQLCPAQPPPQLHLYAPSSAVDPMPCWPAA
jgi:hypothetical protein